MNFKNALGLVAHKLFDWKTVVNPITRKFYPELYSIKHIFPSFRKKTVQWFFITPYPSLMIDRQLRQLENFSFANIAKYRLIAKYGAYGEKQQKQTKEVK